MKVTKEFNNYYNNFVNNQGHYNSLQICPDGLYHLFDIPKTIDKLFITITNRKPKHDKYYVKIIRRKSNEYELLYYFDNEQINLYYSVYDYLDDMPEEYFPLYLSVEYFE